MCELFTRAILINSVLLFVLLQASNTNGANILGVFTSKSPSHLIVHMSVAKALAERGHNVTVVTAMKPVVSHESIRNILIPVSAERDAELQKKFSNLTAGNHNIFSILTHFVGSSTPLLDAQFDVVNDARFKALYETPDTKFDLVLVGYFMNDFQLGVAAKFKCPVALIWTSNPNDFVNRLVGNPGEVAYVPANNVPTEVGEAMTFLERVKNLLSSFFFKSITFAMERQHKRMYSQLFGSEKNFPTYDEATRNVSLLFCNSHFSEGPIRPNVPGIVEIGGIQIKDKPDALPQDIADFLNNSGKNGAVLFSLGSNLKSSTIDPTIVHSIFKVLTGLKQNVIWKWEDLENTPGQSNNIMYKKWLPQDDILAHPNVKLFITHAGKGGTAEAQYHAVPMVALPIFADQHGNAEKMVMSGFGVLLKLLDLNEANFKAALEEVLYNPVYANNAKRFSDLYKDRPLTAKESVVYWTEYIIRHKGAKHMQSPLVHMSAMQSSNLDVIAFLLLVLYLVWRLLKFVVKFVWCVARRLANRTKRSNSKKLKTQ